MNDILSLDRWVSNLKKPLVIAGPCSAENPQQVLETAIELEKIPEVKIFRAGIWKPRTRPNSFEGIGEQGLSWLQEVKNKTRLLTCTEVANPQHAELALKYGVDILWVGARTTVNPFTIQEIAEALKGTNIPVMVKNPMHADLGLWKGAIERFYNIGLRKIIAIHRGFFNIEETLYRNRPFWNLVCELKREIPNLPIICDPSHISGKRELVGSVVQKAMDIDMDGLMIETHLEPSQALSDADQQVTPKQLIEILNTTHYPTEFSSDRNFEEELVLLREKIDSLDKELIDILLYRQKLVDKIGKAKVKNNITAFQVKRLDSMIKDRMDLADNIGLSKNYVKDLFNVIHNESVKQQINLMEENKNSPSPLH